MRFSPLLGNQRIKDNLSGAIAKGRISHFYLICGPEGSGKHTLANLLAAAILCQGSNKPCLSCHPCRKVMNGLHPDFITIDDPEKKTVPVELIRQARADIYIQPSEASHKIYLFPRAHDMGVPGQNALLKVLEEPPKYGVFILLTENPESLLPTVRSRCTQLQLLPLSQTLLQAELQRRFPDAQDDTLRYAVDRSGGWLGQAMELLQSSCALPPQTELFLEGFASRDTYGLLQALLPMEKLKRDQLIPLLFQWKELLEQALACRSGMPAPSAQISRIAAQRSSRDLMNAVRELHTCIEYAQGNISPGAICGYLVWALRR